MLSGIFKMTHNAKSKSSNETKPQNLENDFAKAKYKHYANSAYRYAKQKGFLRGEDVLKSIETKHL